MRWLAEQAEQLGVNIFPGFAATEIIYDGDRVVGIVTGDKGLDKNGQPKSTYQPGIELRAKQVIFAEGCRGSLTQTLFPRYNLREGVDPQTYGLGIKELWEIPEALHQRRICHAFDWMAAGYKNLWRFVRLSSWKKFTGDWFCRGTGL